MPSKPPREPHTIRYQSAGGIVLDADGRVLLIERTVDGHHEVRLPKGHIDPGESAKQAAIREVCEETGYCDVQVLADLGRQLVEFDRNGDQVVRDEQYYLMRLTSRRRQAPQFMTEREALFRNRWVTNLFAAQRLLTFEAEKDAARRAQEAQQALLRQEASERRG